MLRYIGIASTDCFNELFSSSTAAFVFGKSVRNERVGGSQGFGASSFFTRFVRSWLENDGALTLRIRVSTLPAGGVFDAGAGLGAIPLATAGNDMKRNLLIAFF